MSLTDLHTHTTRSDGTLTPIELVEAALRAGVRTLAVTDHDRVFEAPEASQAAARQGLDLICGIELSCRHEGRTVHLLGYFFNGVDRSGFDAWLNQLLDSRRDRNRRLAARLRDLGVAIELEEAESYGHGLTGRPHFARVLMDKGYVASLREAFDRYLGESAPGYVERDSPDVPHAVRRMLAAGAVASLAHPVRLAGRDPARQEQIIRGFAESGLTAIEAFHSDHAPADAERFVAIAGKYGMAVSGGSDFHGANKPGVELGTGVKGNLRVPDWVVPALRQRAG
ncbi:MAG: PHP domain-containing protein [Acidobacteria bacterium]|nr:PHP domain-containing protein [Acidobacteriota bacterium]